MSSFIIPFCCKLTPIFLRGIRKNIEVNLSRAFPDWDEKKIKKFAKKVICNLTSFFWENVLFSLGKCFCYMKVNVKKLNEIIKKYPKIIFLTAHVGNWEILSALVKKLELDEALYTIVADLSNKFISNYIKNFRENCGIKVVFKKKKRIKELYALLKKSKYLALLGDQNIKTSHKIYVDFFGSPAPTTDTISIIAKKFNYVILPIFCVREKFCHYKIVWDDVIFPEKFEKTEDITVFYTKIIEKWIKKYPSQWVWFHKRWQER